MQMKSVKTEIENAMVARITGSGTETAEGRLRMDGDTKACLQARGLAEERNFLQGPEVHRRLLPFLRRPCHHPLLRKVPMEHQTQRITSHQ